MTARRPVPSPSPAAAPADSPWQPAGQRSAQREQKRQAVLQTAARLFNQKGFHATSLDDIAQQLHVSKPTLYYYVKSKDDILLECVRIALDHMRTEIAKVRQRGGRALDQLIVCMRLYAHVVTQEYGRCVIRIGEDPLPAPLRKELRRLKAGIDLQFRRLLEEGIAEGSILACDPKMAAFMLGGALSWIGRWYREDGDLTPDQVADQAVALLLGGVLRDRRQLPRATRSAVRSPAQSANRPPAMRATATPSPLAPATPRR